MVITKALAVALALAIAAAGWQTIRLSSAHEDIADLRADHADLVAAAERERANASERYRELERQRDAEIDVLRTKIGDREHDREKSAAAARLAGDRLRIALATVAEQARRAAENPGAAGRTDAACATTAELFSEADAEAGELAETAGKLAGQVTGLQEYVRTVCLRSIPILTPNAGNPG